MICSVSVWTCSWMVGWGRLLILGTVGWGFSFDHSGLPHPADMGPPMVPTWTPTLTLYLLLTHHLRCFHLLMSPHLDLHHSLLYWATGWKIQLQSLLNISACSEAPQTPPTPVEVAPPFLVPFWTPSLGFNAPLLPRCSVQTRPTHYERWFHWGFVPLQLRFWMDIHVETQAFSLCPVLLPQFQD